MTTNADVYTGHPAPSSTTLDPHVALWIDGRDITCDTIDELSISGGRADKLSQPDVATVTFTLAWDTVHVLPDLGQSVHIAGWPVGHPDHTYALFSGMITDLAWEDPYLTVVAADLMRTTDGLFAGSVTFNEEPIHTRVARIWDALVAAAGAPAWMGDGDTLVGSGDASLWPFDDIIVAETDPVRLQGLDELYRPLGWVGSAIIHRPNGNQPTTGDPSTWTPDVVVRPGLSLDPAASDPVPEVSCRLLVGDPPPRYWQNLGVYTNVWQIKYGPDGDDEYIAQSVPSALARYGPRSGTIDTTLAGTVGGTGTDVGRRLAEAWLNRHQVPVWYYDNTTLVITTGTEQATSQQDIIDAWKVAAFGANQVGRLIRIQWTNPGNHESWVIEQSTFEWARDGWYVGLVLSPASVYDGTAGIINPLNSWRGVVGEHVSWDDTAADHPLWQDLVSTPHPHSGGP